jgi:hypothetical protein
VGVPPHKRCKSSLRDFPHPPRSCERGDLPRKRERCTDFVFVDSTQTSDYFGTKPFSFSASLMFSLKPPGMIMSPGF